jgi:uncharacterized cupin superfamily protein
MPPLNLASADVSYDETDPDGFRAGMGRLGRLTGATTTGVSVYELPPGQAICPYHYEVGEEEWLLVVSGHPTLRTPAGNEQLAPWDVAFFPRGREGAHAVRNETSETVRVAMFSDIRYPGATVYPDSDKIGIWTGGDKSDDLLVRRSAGVEYYDGEVSGAG